MPRTPPPAGQVGLNQAIEHLRTRGIDVTIGMIYKWVDAGKLGRYGEGRKHKFYKLAELDKLADEQTGVKRVRLNASFQRATLADMPGVELVAAKLFTTPTLKPIPAETRQEWLRKEPRGHYLVKRANGEVLSYIHIIALQQNRIDDYMSGMSGRYITYNDVQSLESGRAMSAIVAAIGSDPDLSNSHQKHSMETLLLGMSEDLKQLAMQGVVLEKLYAWTESESGLLLCARMGMQQYCQPRLMLSDDGHRAWRYFYFLDVLNSPMPILSGYQKAHIEWQAIRTTMHPEKPLARPTDAPVIWKDATPQTPIERPLISPTTPPTIWQEVIPPTRKQGPEKATLSPQKGIEEGSIALRLFADLHHVKSRTASDQARIGTGGEILEATERAATPGRDRWFLTPEQQRQAVQFWQRHKTPGFTPCPDCPH